MRLRLCMVLALGWGRVAVRRKEMAPATDPDPWGIAHGGSEAASVLASFAQAAAAARSSGLGVNAGHDLNLANLTDFLSIDGILEVSIGHALTVDALHMGFVPAVEAYLAITGD